MMKNQIYKMGNYQTIIKLIQNEKIMSNVISFYKSSDIKKL